MVSISKKFKMWQTDGRWMNRYRDAGKDEGVRVSGREGAPRTGVFEPRWNLSLSLLHVDDSG